MNSTDEIKKNIERLFRKNPNIHINIRMTKPKIELKNDPAKIKGVYPNFFVIEESSSGYKRIHSIRYIDIVPGYIEIVELGPVV